MLQNKQNQNLQYWFKTGILVKQKHLNKLYLLFKCNDVYMMPVALHVLHTLKTNFTELFVKKRDSFFKSINLIFMISINFIPTEFRITWKNKLTTQMMKSMRLVYLLRSIYQQCSQFRNMCQHPRFQVYDYRRKLLKYS